MRIEITLYRSDVFEHKKNADIKDITLYDFPFLTRQLKAQAYIIRFVDEVNGLIRTKTLKDVEHQEVFPH